VEPTFFQAYLAAEKKVAHESEFPLYPSNLIRIRSNSQLY
jgi:hypothetical protein